MPRNRKPELYAMLKETGAPLTTTYMKYTAAELESELHALGVDTSEVTVPEQPAVAVQTEDPMPPFRLWSFLRRLLPSQ